jgi:CRISPR/Cas system-associated endoribonuclease Cas2
MATNWSISDLADVLAALTGISKSYQLGIQLKLNPVELNEIERNYPRDIDRQKTEVIIYWLSNSPDASWTTLANAVERLGGHVQLTQTLRERAQFEALKKQNRQATSDANASRLSISDLVNVLAALTGISKPYLLGIQLKLNLVELNEIERNHPRDIDRQKTEVIIYWLSNSPDASWTTLANAVERLGGHVQLTQTLRERAQFEALKKQNRQATSDANASRLSISDLVNVLAALTGISKPYLLGIQLKLNLVELKEIEKNHPRDIDRQKTEVIKYWLRNSTDASWTTLANAVERLGGHARLAQTLKGRAEYDIDSIYIPHHVSTIRQHSHAPTQNHALSEMLRAKSEECDRLTDELEALKKQNRQATSDSNASIKITACEQEISALKLRVEELEGTPEGQNRQSSGGLNSKIEELSVQLQKAVEEMKDIKKVFQKERQKSGILYVLRTCWLVYLCGSKMV